jgi:hypothetical protein
MTLTLEVNLKPDDQARLTRCAKQSGMTLETYVQTIVEKLGSSDVALLRSLSRADRNRVLSAQAIEAAALYEADLALPVKDRELTAFSALDGDPVHDLAS